MSKTNFDLDLEEQLRNPDFATEYKKLEPEFAIIKQLILLRNEQGMTQKDLADRTGTTQTAISRLESGSYNPTLRFLQKMAVGLGKTLRIEFR